MKAYFDQNIWEHLADTMPPDSLNSVLSGADIRVCLGMHNVYEFGRCFLNGQDSASIERGKAIFGYLAALENAYLLKPTNELVRSDLIFARTGGRLLPFLDQLNVVAAKAEIVRLSHGWSNRAEAFIRGRESSLAKEAPIYRVKIVQGNRRVRVPSDFAALREDWTERRAVLEKSDFRSLARHARDVVLFSSPEKYPFVNTFISAQLYFNFVALTNPKGPSKKLTSDYRHLIDSNAADCFVTNDSTLKRNAAKLCPYNTVCNWEEFRQRTSGKDALPGHQAAPNESLQRTREKRGPLNSGR